MTTVTSLGVDQLSLRGAGTDYNILSRFFATKAQADAALADSSWVPTAGKTNGCLTGDQGLLVYDFNTSALVVADAATRTYADTAIATAVAALVDSAPGTLDTLNELAAAINDDANAYTTLNNAIAAVQTDVNTNEADADAAIAANETHIDNMATLTGVAKDSTDLATFTGSTIADSSTVKTALQALETKVEAVQTDVDGNETDADAAIAANEVHIDNAVTLSGVAKDATNLGTFNGGSISDNRTVKQALQELETKVEAVQTDVDGNETDADTAIALKANIVSPTFTGTPAAPTASAGTNTTQLATTAFVSTAVANTIDGAPGALDTLNELAAALGDDANFSTTITNLITANEAHIDNVATLSGVAKDAVNLGTFTGSTVSDARNIKQAVQELETAIEAVQTDVDGNESDADAAIAGILDGADFTGNITTNGNITCSSGTLHAQYLTLANVNVNSTAAELNILDGVTSTTAELNILDGVTATTTELNLLDGVTATTAELNYVDGVTSNIQTQLDAIQSDVDTNESDADSAIAAVQADVDQNESDADAAIALKADIAGPTFTGAPAAPTASAGTNTTQLATTAFVKTAVDNLIDGAPGALDTLNEIADAIADDANVAANLTTLINARTTAADGIHTGTTQIALLKMSSGLVNASDDTAAASAGVAVNQLYRNGSVVMIRVS